MTIKADHAGLFSLEDDLTIDSRKSDGISWSRWNVYVLQHIQTNMGPQDGLDAFHEAGKMERGVAYEKQMSAREYADSITGLSEKPMAVLVRD